MLNSSVTAPLAILLLFALTAAPSHANEPSREIRELAGEAEALLDALNPKEAVRILERGRAGNNYRRADRSAKARLLVILGRARAELSDESAMMKAFREAVSLDPGVRLSKVNTSPKIIAALERARLEAPVATKPPASKPPASKSPPASRPPASRLPPAPVESNAPSALAWWIEGPMVSGARVRLVIDTAALPKDAIVEAQRRFDLDAAPSPLALTRSGTTATAVIDLDARPFEVVMVARHRDRVIAQAGTKESPVRFSPKAAPSLADAWSKPTSAPTTKSSTVALAGLTPPATSAAATEGGDATGDSLTLLFTFGMVGLMAAAVIVSVTLLVGGPDCDAAPGFGCSEVHVSPLTRF